MPLACHLDLSEPHTLKGCMPICSLDIVHGGKLPVVQSALIELASQDSISSLRSHWFVGDTPAPADCDCTKA